MSSSFLLYLPVGNDSHSGIMSCALKGAAIAALILSSMQKGTAAPIR